MNPPKDKQKQQEEQQQQKMQFSYIHLCYVVCYVCVYVCVCFVKVKMNGPVTVLSWPVTSAEMMLSPPK